ncbi:MAG: thermonuclease family protein [Candidatus Omnitrophica bacterium]|nr:thermonuclease family protein [Candidatus Omnitrophota bacterium]
MPKSLAKSDGYKTLVKRITREFAELEVFVKSRFAKAYWNVGKYIDDHLLAHKDRPAYAAGFYEKLAEDTGRERTTLQWAVRFHRAYPICDFNHKLTWAHYKGLLTVQDTEERKKLEEKIIRHDWDTTKLREYLSVKRRLAAPANDDNPVPQLKFTRGKLHTYQIVPANKTLVHRGPLALDLGFREQYAIPPGAPRLKENDTVELVLKDGELAGVSKVAVPKDELFTYKAAVERVVDGDTLLVSFDFQCPMSVGQKLRLRGIDCPEIDTEEGRRAKRFVEARLKDCDFIVVKTYKDRTDKFDRYLADIFYLPGVSDPAVVTREGKFLNQELLDEHLAVVYQ